MTRRAGEPAKIWSIIVELLDVTLVGTVNCFNPKNLQHLWWLLTSLGTDLLFKIFFWPKCKSRLNIS